MNDPLESLRNKDCLSLREAAHAACDVPMDGALAPLASGANSARVKVVEVLRGGQRQSDQVRAMLRSLVVAVDDPLDRLPAAIKRAPSRSERLRPGQIGYAMQSTFRTLHSAEVDPDETTVSRADLKAWCDTQQLRPSIFYPFDNGAGKPLGTTERENLLRLIGVLCELAGIDLQPETKGHAEAKRIADAIGKRNVRIGAETVAKQIAGARELIAPKGPEQLPSNSNSNRRRSSSS